MGIFCDESGGSDPSNNAFVVVAVAMAPSDATRLIKSFRKATGVVGEVKGHGLALPQRRVFFELLLQEADALSAAVASRRSEPVGGWAMRALPEVVLYEHLLAEALTSLPRLGAARHLTLTLDRPRYKKAQLHAVRSRLCEVVRARHGTPADIGFGDSAGSAGLQMADVIANSVFQMGRSPAVADLVAPVVECGRLLLRPVRLEAIRPGWLAVA